MENAITHLNKGKKSAMKENNRSIFVTFVSDKKD